MSEGRELVNHPQHYNDASGVECIDVIEHMLFSSGNAFKYIYRAGAKDETIQEFKKAIWYLNRAKDRNEFNTFPLHIKDAVSKIAQCRHEYIGEAMNAIYYGEWNQAIVYVNSYITYLDRLHK